MDVSTEVICQHRKDGSILPIKIKFENEDGEVQIYRILRYRECGIGEGYIKLPNSIYATRSIRRFECKIQVFGREKDIVLFYNTGDGRWNIRC